MTEQAEFDKECMRAALEEARRAIPSPNPPVGAVLVSPEREILAKGFHVEAGGPHAEEVALANVGEAAKGATLYVTMEPCNHYGRRPPCVDRIVESGVSRVVIGCEDPNPNVEGRGAERLAELGLDVVIGVREDEAQRLIQHWTTFITKGRPHIALKLALSLDGRIATRSGASKWITGAAARAKVQELRILRDAVGVGIGTVLADDPRLTVREAPPEYEHRRPVRITFDTKLRMPLKSALCQTSRETTTVVVGGEEAPEEAEEALVEAGCQVLRVPTSAEGRLDMASAMRLLADLGIVSILVEGGAELSGSLLAAQLADEMHAFIAPILLGPRGRPGAVDWAGPDRPSEAPHIVEPTWELCGNDAYVFGPLAFPDPEEDSD